jgi:mannosyl-3-phosphoglycerate phosphatase
MSSLSTLVFSDLDGTLLDHFTYQSSPADKTLAQLKCANIPVILNTSKTLAELAIIHSELKLDTPFIVENGAAIYIPIATFLVQPADTEIVGDYWVKSFCLPRQHWLTLLAEQTDEFKKYYQGFSTMSAADLTEITGLSLTEAKRAQQRQYGEPIQWFGDEVSKNRFIDHLIDLGANVVQGGRFIHIGGYCDKGQALIWLTEQYRENFNNPAILTIALGDGENDSPMLEAADIAVQIRSPVHNFPKLYRQFKTTRTLDYGPEGWAQALQTLLAKQLLSSSTII